MHFAVFALKSASMLQARLEGPDENPLSLWAIIVELVSMLNKSFAKREFLLFRPLGVAQLKAAWTFSKYNCKRNLFNRFCRKIIHKKIRERKSFLDLWLRNKFDNNERESRNHAFRHIFFLRNFHSLSVTAILPWDLLIAEEMLKYT